MTRMPRARRPWTAAVALLAAGLVLAGCGGLPVNTTVQPGLDVNGVNEPPLEYVPPGPSAGQTPDEVMRSFLNAGTASGGVYDVARAFLSKGALSWAPDHDELLQYIKKVGTRYVRMRKR